MDRTLVIICPKQFGYLSDYYYYCLNLTEYRIIYIGKEQGLKVVENPVNTEVYHLTKSLFLFKVVSFLKRSSLFNDDSNLFVYYHRFCFLYTLLLPTKIRILDVRTGDVSKNSIKRIVFNALLKIESLFFTYIFTISESLRKELGIRKNKTTIIPLGAVEIGYQKRDFKRLDLLYVGTFFNRNVHLTIQGLSIFRLSYPELDVSYTIIGFGPSKDVDKIRREITKAGQLGTDIKYLGRLHHSELTEYFINSNIGVSFIPLVKYFDCQPPTKTFEYICSGLVCIATQTTENKRIITENNGILIKDNPYSFAKGLKHIWDHRNKYDSNYIRSSAAEYHWNNIVGKYLRPALERILC